MIIWILTSLWTWNPMFQVYRHWSPLISQTHIHILSHKYTIVFFLSETLLIPFSTNGIPSPTLSRILHYLSITILPKFLLNSCHTHLPKYFHLSKILSVCVAVAMHLLGMTCIMMDLLICLYILAFHVLSHLLVNLYFVFSILNGI